MTISELIDRLELIKQDQGDLIVKVLSMDEMESWVDPEPEVNSNWLLL